MASSVLHSYQKNVGEQASKAKLAVLPLVFLIFYEVSGGPIGTEASVQAAGPFLAIVGFLLFPFIWSIPEALITAEMSTAYPENGGYVLWTSAAFGPFWGFLQGWWKWVSGVINIATYPVLCLDYLKVILPVVAGGVPRLTGIVAFTSALTWMNYRGLTIVGWSAVFLGVFSLLPFLFMSILAIPRLKPSRWLALRLTKVDWRQYLNTLFWNLNFWDNASTLAGEVEDPQKAFPKALLYAGVLVGFCYVVPLLAGTGAFEVNPSQWEDGHYAALAGQLGGLWLNVWVEGAAVVSCLGLFAAQMSSSSFQVLGMAEMGFLPSFLGFRSVHNTPTIGVIMSACGAFLLSFMSFQNIVQAANALYGCGMLLELAAFICLRIKDPSRNRPFKIPFNTPGVVIMCAAPSILLLVVLALSSIEVLLIASVATGIGLLLHVCLGYSKKRKWMKFTVSEDLHKYSFENNPSKAPEEIETRETSVLLHA